MVICEANVALEILGKALLLVIFSNTNSLSWFFVHARRIDETLVSKLQEQFPLPHHQMTKGHGMIDEQ